MQRTENISRSREGIRRLSLGKDLIVIGKILYPDC